MPNDVPAAELPDGSFDGRHAFRAHLQKTLRRHLDDVPRPDPLAGVSLPSAPDLETVRARWREPSPALPVDYEMVNADPSGPTLGTNHRLAGLLALALVGCRAPAPVSPEAPKAGVPSIEFDFRCSW